MKPKLQSSTFKINKIAPLKEKSANYFLLNRIYYRDQKTMQGKHYEHVAATIQKYWSPDFRILSKAIVDKEGSTLKFKKTCEDQAS